MSLLQKEPVFEIKFEAYGAQYYININGVTIFSQFNSAGKINTRFPVNHYMRSGKNEISVETWSDDDDPINPNAYVNIELVVSENTKPETQFTITTLKLNHASDIPEEKTISSSAPGRYNSSRSFEPDDNGDVIVNDISFSQFDHILHFKRNITLENSLPLWAFFDSDDLPDYDSFDDDDYLKSVKTLLPEYMIIQDAIENKEITKILPLFAERNKELDLAFYYPKGTYDAKIKKALTEASEDIRAELVEVIPENLGILRNNNKKLGKIYRGEIEDLITLNYKNGMGSYSFDIIYRQENGKWIISR